MSGPEITVAVTSVGSGIGQSVIQSLRDSELKVRIVGFEISAWAMGAYECDSAYMVPRATDPAYKSELLRRCLETGVNILIPGSDSELHQISELQPKLRSHGCHTIVSGINCVQVCRDKLALHEYLAQFDAPFVATWSEAYARSHASSLPYPLLIKPKNGSGSVGARVLPNQDAWAWIPAGENNIVQPYLLPWEWGEAEIGRLKEHRQLLQEKELSVQFLLSPQGELCGRFASVNRLKAGVPVQVDPIDREEIWQAAQKVVCRLVPLGLKGPCNLQGRWTDDGVMFFEVNPRFTGITSVRTRMGFNEVEDAIRLFYLGETPHTAGRSARAYIGLGQMAYLVIPRRRFRSLQDNSILDAHIPLSRAVVTGVTGYLGDRLVRSLLGRNVVQEVVAPVRNIPAAEATWSKDPLRSRLQFVSWELHEPLCKLEDCELIVHCAAVRPLPGVEVSSFELNVRAMRHLVDFARRRRVSRFVFASSQAVYGNSASTTANEEDPLIPETAYAFSKVAGEALLQTLVGSHTRWAILRIPRLYGSGQNANWRTWPHVFVDRVLAELDVELTGDPKQSMELLHIEDCVYFVLHLLNQPISAWDAIYNVGSGRATTIAQVAEICISLGKEIGRSKSSIVYRPRRPAGGTSITMDNSKARGLGWEPRRDLRDGIRELMASRIRTI